MIYDYVLCPLLQDRCCREGEVINVQSTNNPASFQSLSCIGIVVAQFSSAAVRRYGPWS